MTTNIQTGKQYYETHHSSVEPDFWFWVFDFINNLEFNEEISEEDMKHALEHFLFMNKNGLDDPNDYLYKTLKTFFLG